MLEFQKKRKIRKIMYSPITLLILGLIAVIFVKAAWNVYTKEAASRDYLNQARTELAKVTATEQALSSSVASLQTQQGVEADIRHKFRVVKPGEQIAVIVDSTSTGSAGSATSSSLWQRFVHFFGF